MRMPPGWDGVETIERLWQVDPRLQAVICTAYSDHSWATVRERLEARDRLLILKKPFDSIEALQLASTLVTKWNLERKAELQLDSLERAVEARVRELEHEVLARRRTESALRVRDRAVEAAMNAVIITDFTAPDNPIEYVNPAFTRITGYTPEEAIGRNPRFLEWYEPHESGLEEIKAAVREQREGRAVLRNRRKDGTTFWNELCIAPVRDDGGTTTHFVGVLNDVSVAREQEGRLRHQATHDSLTGLPNRVMLHDRLDQGIAYARRTRDQVAVLWLDLDHFKFINDSYGHRTGDELLTLVAGRLKATVRESDTVVRLGGDEFVVLMLGVGVGGEAMVSSAARRILDALSEPFEVEGRRLHASASVGISLFPEDGQTSEQLLMHADTAMYRAKSEGRNGFQFYRRELGQQAQERESLTRALHSALENQEFELHYQPKVTVVNRRICGIEALIRWRHPELGMVSPLSFIPIAEETGLIVPIGEWVLATACRQAKAWQDAGFSGLTMAVNVSARQFQKNDMLGTVQRCLAKTGLPGKLLELEITESLLMEKSEALIHTLNGIKAMGVSLAIDDFGTGFSSLGYLRHFPLDNVKIDRAFVANVTTNRADASIAKAIIAMSHSLGLKVVAEGVESSAHLSFLMDNHCDAAQGYLFSRPLPAEQLTAMLPGMAAAWKPADTKPDIRITA
jgi:diguanylate cyclase (GGDEF)-like protein/PAS domain S-box-containing protein